MVGSILPLEVKLEHEAFICLASILSAVDNDGVYLWDIGGSVDFIEILGSFIMERVLLGDGVISTIACFDIVSSLIVEGK